ncbi:hypothetical protein [Mesorhizobium sp. SP-1A]|uniref:hypothetical protein n=1 Tax=Mesorhizobium sp. SP-1A TaxID=3077840 RepID=UPI0028F71178|nr:hypothetical protein [Mesorhizobium sp. SP-1A]
MYTLRDISREAAARCLRVSENTLDSFIHRYGLGGKRRGARVFSVRDLAEFKTARNLAGPDLSIADALAIVRQHLATEPPDGTSLIVTDDGEHWIQPDEQQWPVRPCRIVHPGWVVQEIKERLDVAI